MTEVGAGQRDVSLVEAIAWGTCAVALSNVIRIALFELPAGGVAVRALHHAIELGHTVLLGTLVAAVSVIWSRFAPKPRVWHALFAWVLAALASQIVLVEDMQGPLEQLGGDPENALSLRALCAFAAMVAPGAFVLGRLGARPRVRWACVAAGALLVFANPHVLEGGYSGAHFFIALTGATLLASALHGARVRRLTRRGWPRFAVPVGWASCSVLGLVAIVARPSGDVEVELEHVESAVLVPWLGDVREAETVADVPVPAEMKPWFQRRKKKAPIAPNARRLLPEGPIVILFTIDAFRYDLMSPRYRNVAPNVHAMRERAVYFSQARSFGAGTRISLSAVFAGRYYSMLDWTRPLSTRPTLERDTLPRFPDLLGDEGVDTVNVLSLKEMLTEEIGVVHGFSEVIKRRKGDEQKLTADLTQQAIERLKNHGSGPLFMFMHVIDPHEPYRTYGKKVASKREAYDLEVKLADESLGRLRRAVSELGLGPRTAFIVTSDHGEGFGENGVWYHNKTVYDIMVHVPLMIEIPGIAPRTIDDYVSVMDVGPTILDLFGVPTPGFWMAESLVPQLLGEPAPKGRPIVMETRFEHGMLFPDGLKAIQRWKQGTELIYDVENDPLERKNLRDELGEEGDRRIALLLKYFRVHAGRRQNGKRF
jgi:arylsulfatase A-like enzyme